MRTENDYTETDLGNISPNPRGEYDEKASYEYLDLISYQGGSYLCLAEPKTIVSEIDPKAGQNTEVWQMIALPGELTPEYIAMHDDTIAKAKQTEASRTAAELAQEAAETARTDVVQMHSETLQAATEARENCDSSAGYAQAAELSRKAAAESEQNINAQVTGFETEVSESVTQATEQIATARQKAVQTITSQQDTSVQAVKDQTAAYISEKNTEAKKEITDHAEQEIVRINAQDSVQQIQKNKEDVALLKEDIGNLSSSKISKFYATNNGENHLVDSDDGKIADMMVYGKSEQKKYQGYQLLEHNTSEYNFTATTSYHGLVNDASENIKSGAYYLRKLGNTPTVLITFLNASKKMVKQEYLTDGSEKRIVFETDVAYVKYIIQNLIAGTDYKGTVKLILASTSGADYEPYVGGVPSPNPDYPQEIKSVVNPTVKVTNEDGLKVQSVTLNNITLNAIPVSSGGNVTIDGQQYVADYVDVERGKLVRMVGVTDQDTFFTSKWSSTGSIVIYSQLSNVRNKNAIVTISSKLLSNWSAGDEIHHFTQPIGQTLVIVLPKTITTVEQGEEIRAKGFKFYYILVTPIEIDLTEEENAALKELATYYPVTNIRVSSEQLDGYAVFNYPISMANGWNYVKQQLNDNRDYIYDMDSRTQDIDTQAAEAYVNSEYAVALTELEV